MHLAIAHNQQFMPNDFMDGSPSYSWNESRVLHSFPTGSLKSRRLCMYLVLCVVTNNPNVGEWNLVHHTSRLHNLPQPNVQFAVSALVGTMQLLTAWRNSSLRRRHQRFFLISPDKQEQAKRYKEFLITLYPEFQFVDIEIPALRRN